MNADSSDARGASLDGASNIPFTRRPADGEGGGVVRDPLIWRRSDLATSTMPTGQLRPHPKGEKTRTKLT